LPCACPKPVLAKRPFFNMKMAPKRRSPHRDRSALLQGTALPQHQVRSCSIPAMPVAIQSK
jgi:hypothetical protein